MLKFLPVMGALAALSFSPFASAEVDKAAESAPRGEKKSDSKSFFPIMAWDWNYDDFNFFAQNPDKRAEQLRMMKESGINIAGIFKIEDTALVEEAGMQTLVMDPRLTYDWIGWLKGKEVQIDEAEAREKVISLVEDIKKLPNNGAGVYGYYLVDEPGSAVYPIVATVSKLLQEHDPSRPIYINLNPNYAPHSYIFGGDYSKYLSEFAAMKPNLISVDNYYLMRPDEWLNPAIPALFYKNMEQMRDMSLELKVPFWSVVLSMPHQTYLNVNHGNLARQIYASLAYGARGISYFCYFQNRSPDATSGPIDREGKKTPIWEVLRDVNHEILALAPVLNELTPERNYFLGTVPEGSASASPEAWVKAQEVSSLLVGEFRHSNGDRYVMLVNTDLRKPTKAGAITIKGNLEEVSRKDGTLGPVDLKTFSIAPGYGALLKLAKDTQGK